ncbi:alpha/beta fold hydrolase [Sulfitobacter sp. BDSS02]|nr:alpha/beta fold hydrolase [Sulfitobacter sp. BDSS02]MBR9848858.1 alpha/beta hydrolase [Paracoccaceae bacterium]
MELDDAYANGAHIAGAETYPPRWNEAAQAFRDKMEAQGRARLGQPYGPGDRHRFDLFLPEGTPKGIVIFVHGGYWLNFDASTWSHLAAGPLEKGWAVALPSYDLCPSVRISEITLQIAQAVQKIAEMVPGPIALTGHSAGGHLVARMLAPEMLPPEVAERITHVVPISPLTDLRPLLRTSMNENLRLDEAEAWAESTIAQPVPDVPATVWVGADERPAFLDQARWLAEAWACGNVIVPGKHHFDVIDALADPQDALVKTLTTPA